ncbi:hypothetical protein [Anaerophaga thermohalophila]|uniref:hypothetical protein n=1 Tax=Anaerophaga thermohalophila TaxID=177400 RepID=UPI000237BA91|nr:hypothetical protein [Anaerophaga thermohalophila]
MGNKQREKKSRASWWDKANQTLAENHSMLVTAAFIIYLFFSFFTFSLRISEGGDDSAYIIRAISFLEEGKFPQFQGPLYPFILSLFIALFGTRIVVLKLSSWIFLSLSVFLLGKAIVNKVSAITFWGIILALVVNHHFLYFGSQTYSEAFFMALQSFFILYLFRTIEKHDNLIIPVRCVLAISVLLLTLYLTRTIAIVAVPAVVLFFFLRNQKKAAWLTILFFVVLSGAFIGLKAIVADSPTGADSQLQSLLMKHPYDASQGRETFGGFFERFAQNSNIYLSKYFAILTGFKNAMSLSKQPLVTILLYAWLIAGMIRFYRRNPYLLFIGIYLIFMLGTTFFALHTIWDQVRLIIPFYPLMIIFLIETVVAYTSKSKTAGKQKIPAVLLAFTILLSTAQTVKQTDFQATFKNISGDQYYGYTPDWQNYLKMVEFASHNLPPESYIACRKPNIARLTAGGKEFYGIYRIDSENADTLITQLYNRGVTHIIVASLRKNPRMRTGQVINTIHRYMKHIADKYPGTFILRKQIGETEPAWLFEVNYNIWQQKNKEE